MSQSEIGGPDVVVFDEIAGWAFKHERALLQYIAVGGKAQCKRSVLFDENDADAFFEHGYDDLDYLLEHDRDGLAEVARTVGMKPGHASKFADRLQIATAAAV